MTSILYYPSGLCNGSLLDCLDLHYYCQKNNLETELVIIENEHTEETMKWIEKLLSERHYDATLYVTSKNPFSCLRIDSGAIFDYTTMTSLMSYIHKKEIVYVSNILKGEMNEFLRKRWKYPNIKLWGEKEYNFICDDEYIQKIVLPDIKELDDRTLVICPGMDEEKIREMYKLSENCLFRKRYSYDNLWGRFNRLIYIQSPVIYDRKPRIIYECRMLGIPIEYHRYKNKIDGSWIRYNDNKKREYSLDDKLIEWIRKHE